MEYGKSEMLKRRRTKIVATVGPTSDDRETIGRLIDTGVDVFRLNMSHGDHDGHRAAYGHIRATAEERGRPIAVLADLCGPKIRVGLLEGGQIQLRDGAAVTVTTRDVVGSPDLIPSQYEGIATDARPGCRILLSDGLLELRVDRIDGTELSCTVVHGGVLKDRKGINLPDVAVSAPCLTEKDQADTRFALEIGVDLLALSFVRSASDIKELRAMLPDDQSPGIIAKIERPEALDAMDEIIAAADGVMVARGDLGVELPAELVPVAQRDLIVRARAQGKPSIVATQMLESMIEHPQPTRAEVSDVSTAVYSGADAVMLSAETASGAYPLRAVEMMDRIARRIESQEWTEGRFRMTSDGFPGMPLDDAVARAVAQLSRDLRIRAIVAFTTSGRTAGVIAAARPAAPLVAASTDVATVRRSNLLWGAVPVLVSDADLLDPTATARRLAKEYDLAGPSEFLLTVEGLTGTDPASAASMTVLAV